MFKIELLGEEEALDDGMRFGRITIGDFTERFGCYPITDHIEDLPRLWQEALQSLVDGEEAVALQHDPRMAWIVYRDDDQCYVQQMLLLRANQGIPERETETEDGDPISEWSVDLSDIEDFVASFDASDA